MTTESLFPELYAELVAEVVEPLPNPCGYPLFVVAYWPRGRSWAIKCQLGEFDDIKSPRLVAMAQELQTKGWKHITVLRLPDGGPWSEKK